MSALQDVAACDLREENCCFLPLPWRWGSKAFLSSLYQSARCRSIQDCI